MKKIYFDGSMWVTTFYSRTTNPKILRDELIKTLKESNFEILDEIQHFFSPSGYTSLFLLSESHLAVHTFPESGVSWIEIASCIEDKYVQFMSNIKKAHLEDLAIVKSNFDKKNG